MTKLPTRYSAREFALLVELIYPEERRHLFTDRLWDGEGFRHFQDPKVTCLEHYWSKAKPIGSGAFSQKPAA